MRERVRALDTVEMGWRRRVVGGSLGGVGLALRGAGEVCACGMTRCGNVMEMIERDVESSDWWRLGRRWQVLAMASRRHVNKRMTSEALEQRRCCELSGTVVDRLG